MNNHLVISTSNNDERYMQLAIAEARKAYAMGEVPVGCIIVADEQIVGRGHNLTETPADVMPRCKPLPLRPVPSGANTLRNAPSMSRLSPV